MALVTDPKSGLEFYELSHPWGMYTPIFPGYEEIKLERITTHAKQGVMTHKIITIFHTSTHVNAPLHLVPGREAVGELALQRFFGSGVVLSIPKVKWEVIEPRDLEAATPAVLADDIVIINTGWHHKYADSKEYFGYAPGLSKGAVVAPPLVDELEPPRRSSPIEAVTVSRHLILQFGKECVFVIVRHRALETLEPLLEFFHALPKLRERFRTDLLLWLDEACCAADNHDDPHQDPGNDEAND